MYLLTVAAMEGGSLDGLATVATAIWNQVGQVVTTVTTAGNEMMLLGVGATLVFTAVAIFKSLVGLRKRRGR